MLLRTASGVGAAQSVPACSVSSAGCSTSAEAAQASLRRQACILDCDPQPLRTRSAGLQTVTPRADSAHVQVELRTASEVGAAYEGPGLQFTLSGLDGQQAGPVSVLNAGVAGFQLGGLVRSAARGPAMDELLKLELFLEGGPEVRLRGP